jgi:hypothetical protein
MPVRRLSGIRLPNRERFLFLADQFGKDLFCVNLEQAFAETKSTYGRAMVALRTRGGAIPERHFGIVSGIPVARAKGQLLAQSVLERLYQVKLLGKLDVGGTTIVHTWDTENLTARRRATIAVEDIALGAMKSWLAKTNWTSHGAVKTRADAAVPQFGQFQFDLVGPSYLSSIVQFKNQAKVNGFVFADILLDKQVSDTDLEPFLAKWSVLTMQRRATRFQPIFIADYFSNEALRLLRANGALIARPETIFGIDAARQLQELIDTIQNAAAAVTNNPTAVFQLLSKITKIEGAASNLRGIFLELVIARVYQLDGYKVDIRQQIRSEDGSRAEIDVKATKGNEVVCIECKGKSAGVLVSEAEIKRWLDVTLPRIKNWFLRNPSLPERKRFEFYTSTNYHANAAKLLATASATHKKHTIGFFSGEEVLAKLKEQDEKSLGQLFSEQFLPGR